MNRNLKNLFLLLLFAVLSPPGWVLADDSTEQTPRLLVHLLDYLAVDYGGAVQNGKVLSLSEYKEQQEFVKKTVELSQTLPGIKSSPEVQSLIQNLNGLIQSKADPEKVAGLARQTQAKVIALVQLPVAPDKWPNLISGRQIFQSTCSKCHGMEGRGDGPSAPGLATKPMNFQNLDKMREMTPFQVFNTVRLGVPNTPMAPFPSYSDQDTWNVAFYIFSLRFQKTGPAPASQTLASLQEALKLTDDQLLTAAAVVPEMELEKKLPGSPEQKSLQLSVLRLHSANEAAQASLDFAQRSLQDALADYQSNHFESASQKALAAYVEGVEPVEPRLKANDPKSVNELEELMGLVRSAINNRQSTGEVILAVQKALDALSRSASLLQQQAPSPWLTFTLAFGILLREGFEALLLIVTLLGIIRASGAARARRWVHGGWLAAVALGIAAWFLSGWLMAISGLGRELMEGITGVVTVAILLYIGFWLHSRTEITRWNAFIQVQIKSALEEKNLIQLSFISFLAAFREAIETVLFLRAIWLEVGSDAKHALGLGVLSAFAAILLLGWLLLKFSTRIPVKTLFNVSSIIMIALAVILTGKSVHSFQEVDILPITLSPLNLHWDWLGLYPTWEPLLFQLGVLVLSVFLWIYGKKSSAKK